MFISFGVHYLNVLHAEPRLISNTTAIYIRIDIMKVLLQHIDGETVGRMADNMSVETTWEWRQPDRRTRSTGDRQKHM